MDIVRTSEWLQVVAAIGVIVGLLLVAYELRQEQELARAQLGSETMAGFQDVAQALRDRDTVSIYTKAITDPESLTFEEQIILDGLFTEVVYTYLVRQNYLFLRGVFDVTPERFRNIAGDLILSNEYGRSWWAEHRSRFSSEVGELLDEAGGRAAANSYRESADRILERVQQERAQQQMEQ